MIVRPRSPTLHLFILSCQIVCLRLYLRVLKARRWWLGRGAPSYPQAMPATN